MEKTLSSVNRVRWQTWVLISLMLVGIFLRTYKFHDWLLFGDDQIRDAYIVSDVITGKSPIPLIGPFMSFSGDGKHSEENSFHMGPVYYYFQIISAKIFGNYPDKLAYPDVFFSLLLIPLFYFFLRIYFGREISLGIVGIYSISAYLITYSRFAWNTNLIPFFVILLLFSLNKFLEKNEKTNWGWIASLGFALGIGFQLHAVVMIIFSIVTFVVFLVSMKRNRLVWKKWSVVLLLFLVLNASQVLNEIETGFNNTKTFFYSINSDNNGTPSVNGTSLLRLENDIDCHIEANFFFLSSYGDERCPHSFVGMSSGGWAYHYLKNTQGKMNPILLIMSLIFSIIGYFLLFYYSKKEKDATKKYFLRLVILYFVVGFLVMLPLSQDNINDFRYFVFGFFMPFIFLGLIMKFIIKKITWFKIHILLIVAIFCLFIYSNVEALSKKTNSLLKNTATCSVHRAILGEIEPAVQYMASRADERKQLYLEMSKSQRSIPDAFAYLLEKQGINLNKITKGGSSAPINSSLFYLSCKREKKITAIATSNTDDSNFNQGIEESENQW